MKTNTQFLSDLLQSQSSVFRIAQYVGAKGYDIEIPHIKERPSYKDRNFFADNYDFLAKKAPSLFRCEVKRRGLDFESLESFPFPTIIVEDYAKIEKGGFIEWYFLTNKTDTGFLFITGAKAKKHAKIVEKRDTKSNNQIRRFVEIGKEHFQYRTLNT